MDVENAELRMHFVQVTYEIASSEAERIAVDHIAHRSSSSSSSVASTSSAGSRACGAGVGAAIHANADIALGSAVADFLQKQYFAIEMLYKRIQLLHRYLQARCPSRLPLPMPVALVTRRRSRATAQDVRAHVIAPDHGIIRSIASLCNRLPVVESVEFREDFLRQYNDVMLMTTLATLTKEWDEVNQLLDKFSVIQERGERRHIERPLT